jgi:ABC-type multidrug transport system ATPase subunit/ABC-type multidrug transport system permease subunit
MSHHEDPPAFDADEVMHVEEERQGTAVVKETSPEVSNQSGLDDPFKPRLGRHLLWKDVSMSLKKGKGDEPKKMILDNVWGEVPKGQVTAIMGPSGSGKTSLLNVLAGRASSNSLVSISSDVRLSNYQVDPTDIEVRKRIAFVAQDDSLQITATPREAIRFSAKLRKPKHMSDEELERLTSTMLSALGLERCADVLVGGALLKGISGGERKRTSVGVELVTSPALVFLDEPTSGLDSFNAVQLCQLLKKVAEAGSSVLFTIHQPSSEIFNSFDRLILLNMGRVMYQGLVADVPDYFASRGFAIPPNYNPADWIMYVALTKSVKELDEAGFSPKDQRNCGPALKGSTKDALGIGADAVGDGGTPGFPTQTKMLLRREMKNLFRATHALKTRTAMTLMISFFVGFLFFQVAELRFEGDEGDIEFIDLQSTFGALLMALLANVFSTALPSLVSFPEERPVFLREYSTNHYSVGSYFLTKLVMELMVTAAQVTVSTVITYFLVGFHAQYGIFWAGIYLMACASTALGVLIGCAVKNPSVAVEYLPAVFMPQILFSGFFVPPELMPDWLAWIRFICPLTYGVRIVVAAEFDSSCPDVVNPVSNVTINYCDEILNNVGTDVDDYWWYFLVLACLFIGFRLLALFVLKRKASHFY